MALCFLFQYEPLTGLSVITSLHTLDTRPSFAAHTDGPHTFRYSRNWNRVKGLRSQCSVTAAWVNMHSCPGEISCPFGCVFSWRCTFLRNNRNCISTASPGNWETGVSNDLWIFLNGFFLQSLASQEAKAPHQTVDLKYSSNFTFLFFILWRLNGERSIWLGEVPQRVQLGLQDEGNCVFWLR